MAYVIYGPTTIETTCSESHTMSPNLGEDDTLVVTDEDPYVMLTVDNNDNHFSHWKYDPYGNGGGHSLNISGADLGISSDEYATQYESDLYQLEAETYVANTAPYPGESVPIYYQWSMMPNVESDAWNPVINNSEMSYTATLNPKIVTEYSANETPDFTNINVNATKSTTPAPNLFNLHVPNFLKYIRNHLSVKIPMYTFTRESFLKETIQTYTGASYSWECPDCHMMFSWWGEGGTMYEPWGWYWQSMGGEHSPDCPRYGMTEEPGGEAWEYGPEETYYYMHGNSGTKFYLYPPTGGGTGDGYMTFTGYTEQEDQDYYFYRCTNARPGDLTPLINYIPAYEQLHAQLGAVFKDFNYKIIYNNDSIVAESTTVTGATGFPFTVSSPQKKVNAVYWIDAQGNRNLITEDLKLDTYGTWTIRNLDTYSYSTDSENNGLVYLEFDVIDLDASVAVTVRNCNMFFYSSNGTVDVGFDWTYKRNKSFSYSDYRNNKTYTYFGSSNDLLTITKLNSNVSVNQYNIKYKVNDNIYAGSDINRSHMMSTTNTFDILLCGLVHNDLRFHTKASGSSTVDSSIATITAYDAYAITPSKITINQNNSYDMYAYDKYSFNLENIKDGYVFKRAVISINGNETELATTLPFTWEVSDYSTTYNYTSIYFVLEEDKQTLTLISSDDITMKFIDGSSEVDSIKVAPNSDFVVKLTGNKLFSTTSNVRRLKFNQLALFNPDSLSPTGIDYKSIEYFDNYILVTCTSDGTWGKEVQLVPITTECTIYLRLATALIDTVGNFPHDRTVAFVSPQPAGNISDKFIGPDGCWGNQGDIVSVIANEQLSSSPDIREIKLKRWYQNYSTNDALSTEKEFKYVFRADDGQTIQTLVGEFETAFVYIQLETPDVDAHNNPLCTLKTPSKWWYLNELAILEVNKSKTQFLGWQDSSGNIVSKELRYEFQITKDLGSGTVVYKARCKIPDFYITTNTTGTLGATITPVYDVEPADKKRDYTFKVEFDDTLGTCTNWTFFGNQINPDKLINGKGYQQITHRLGSMAHLVNDVNILEVTCDLYTTTLSIENSDPDYEYSLSRYKAVSGKNSKFQNIIITQRRVTDITPTSNLKELIGYSINGTTYYSTQIDTFTLPSGHVTIVPITQDIPKCDITIIPTGDCTITFNGQAVTKETTFSYNHTKYFTQGYQLVVERSNPEYKFKDIRKDITFEHINETHSYSNNVYTCTVRTDANFTNARIHVTIHKTDALVRFLEVTDAKTTFDGKNVPVEEYYFYGDYVCTIIEPNNFVPTMFVPALDINRTQSPSQPISVTLDNKKFLFDYLVSQDYGATQEVQAYIATGDIRIDASIVSTIDGYDDSLSITPSAVYIAENSRQTFTINNSTITNRFGVKKWKYIYGDQSKEFESVNKLVLDAVKTTQSVVVEAQELFAYVATKRSLRFLDYRSAYLSKHVTEELIHNGTSYNHGTYYFNDNEYATVKTTIDSEYENSTSEDKPRIVFIGWHNGNGELVSKNKTFSFNASQYSTIYALYVVFTNCVSCYCDSYNIGWALTNATYSSSIGTKFNRDGVVWFNEGDVLKISTTSYSGTNSARAERIKTIEGNGPFGIIEGELCEWEYKPGLTHIDLIHEKSLIRIGTPTVSLDPPGSDDDNAVCRIVDPTTQKSIVGKHIFEHDSIQILSYPVGYESYVLDSVVLLVNGTGKYLTNFSDYVLGINKEFLDSLGWDDKTCYEFNVVAFFVTDCCYLSSTDSHTRRNTSANKITPLWSKKRVGLNATYKFNTVIKDAYSRFTGWYEGSKLLGTENELQYTTNGVVDGEYSIVGKFEEYDAHVTIVSDYISGTTKYGGTPEVDKAYAWVGDTITVKPNEYNDPNKLVTKLVGIYYIDSGRHDIPITDDYKFIITKDMVKNLISPDFNLEIHAVYTSQICTLTINPNDWKYFSSIKVNGTPYTAPLSFYKGAQIELSAEMIDSSTYDVVKTVFLNWSDGAASWKDTSIEYIISHDTTITANGANCNYFVEYSSSGTGTVISENAWYYVTENQIINVVTSTHSGGDRYTPDTYVSNIAIRNAGSVVNIKSPTFDLADFIEGLVKVHVTFSDYQTYLDWSVNDTRLAAIDDAPSRHWFNYGEVLTFRFLCNGTTNNTEKKPTYIKTFTINGTNSGYEFDAKINSYQTHYYTISESFGSYQNIVFIAEYIPCVWISFAVDPRSGHNIGSLQGNYSQWYLPNTLLTTAMFPKPINGKVALSDGTIRESRFITWWYYNANGEITDCAYDSTAHTRIFVVDPSLGEKQTVYARFDVANIYVTFAVDGTGATGSIKTKSDWFAVGETINVEAVVARDEETGKSTRVAYWYVDVDDTAHRINTKEPRISWQVVDSDSDNKTTLYVKFEAPNIHVYTQNLPGQEQWGYYNMTETWVFNGEVLNLRAHGYSQIFAEGNCKSEFVEWLMESESVSSRVVGRTYDLKYTVSERNGYGQKLSARFELAPSDTPDTSDTPSTPSKPSKPPTDKVDTLKWNYLEDIQILDDVPIKQSIIACANPSYSSNAENDKVSSGLTELETNKSIPSKYSIAKYYRVKETKTVIYWIYSAKVSYMNSTKGALYSETFDFDYEGNSSYVTIPINQSIVEVNKTKFRITLYRKPMDNFNTKDKIRYRGAFTDVLASTVYNDTYTVLLAKISVDLSAYYIQQYVNNDYSFRFRLNYFDYSGNETASVIDFWENTYKFPKQELNTIGEWNKVIDLDVYDYTSKLFNYVYDKAKQDKVKNLKTTSILLSMCCTIIDKDGYEYEQPRQLLKLYANGYAMRANSRDIAFIDQWVPRIEIIKGYPQNTFSYKNLPVRGFSTYRVSGQDNDRDGFKLYTQVIGKSTNTNYIKDTFCNLQFLQGSDILKQISQSYSDWDYEDNSKRCLLEYAILPGARDVKSIYTLYANNIVGYTRQYEDLKIETETLYGWEEPKVKLEQYFACDSNLIRHPETEKNDRAYLKFSISYSSVGRENKIELSEDDVKLYMRPVGTEHWTEFTVNYVSGYYEMFTNASYQLAIGSTYEVMIKVRDYVMRWYSKPHIEYGFNINFWNIPLSLTKSATGDQGAALNAAVGEYEYDLKMYRDVNFKPDSKMTSTDGKNTITKDLYNIFARGGQNSVVADESNVAQNSYVNTLAIKTESEYAKLSEREKSFESKTLYFVVED